MISSLWNGGLMRQSPSTYLCIYTFFSSFQRIGGSSKNPSTHALIPSTLVSGGNQVSHPSVTKDLPDFVFIRFPEEPTTIRGRTAGRTGPRASSSAITILSACLPTLPTKSQLGVWGWGAGWLLTTEIACICSVCPRFPLSASENKEAGPWRTVSVGSGKALMAWGRRS